MGNALLAAFPIVAHWRSDQISAVNHLTLEERLRNGEVRDGARMIRKMDIASTRPRDGLMHTIGNC